MKALFSIGLLIFLFSNLHAQIIVHKTDTASLKDFFRGTNLSTKPIPAYVLENIKMVEDYGGTDGEGWDVISDSLKAYIKNNGFVALFDKDALPATMHVYYDLMMDSVYHRNAMLANWYVKLGTFKDSKRGFYFVLYSLWAIISDMNELKEIKVEKERIKLENDTSKKKHVLINDYTGPAGYIFSYSKKMHTIKLIKYQF